MITQAQAEGQLLQRELERKELFSQVQEFNKRWEGFGFNQRVEALQQVIDSVKKYPENLPFLKVLIATHKWDRELKSIGERVERTETIRKVNETKRVSRPTEAKPSSGPTSPSRTTSTDGTISTSRTVSTSGTVSTRELSNQLKIPPRKLRQLLRKEYGAQYKRWELTPEQVELIREKLGSPMTVRHLEHQEGYCELS